MKKGRLLISLVMILMVIFIPLQVDAKIKSCEEYGSNTCPTDICEVKDGKCTDTYIGDDVCKDKNVINGLKIAGYLLFVAKFFVPILIIGFGTWDLVKAVLGGDPAILTKQAKSLGIRCVVGLIVFCVPAFVNVILKGIPEFDALDSEYGLCRVCLLDPFKCEEGYVEPKAKEKRLCSSYSLSTCPSKDEAGNKCGKVNTASGPVCKQIKECSSYSASNCPAKDDAGNQCEKKYDGSSVKCQKK